MHDDMRRRKISLLHVDDSEDFLLLTRLRLGMLDQDIEIVSASNCDTALAQLGERSFTCVISDVQMPEMDGLELLRTLRSSGNGTPFIFLSSCEDNRTVDAALNNGAVDYISKGHGGETYRRVVEAVRRTQERFLPEHRTTPPPAPLDRARKAA